MVIKISRFLLLATLLLISGISAQAQIYRVNNNIENGSRGSDMQVYEFDYVAQKPEFPGGNDKVMDYINNHREYPREAYDKRIQGRVTCSFIVNTDGSISDVSILRSVHYLLDEEAMRIIYSMPRWTPGRHDGRRVPVRVVQSVLFRR